MTTRDLAAPLVLRFLTAHWPLLGSQAHSHRSSSLPLASAEISYSLGASPALEVRSCHDVLGLVSTLSWSWRLIPFEHVVA